MANIKDKKKKKNKENMPSINHLEIGLQFGLILFVPLIILILVGLKLDKTYGTLPLFILLGMFASLFISTYALYKKIKQIFEDLRIIKK